MAIRSLFLSRSRTLHFRQLPPPFLPLPPQLDSSPSPLNRLSSSSSPSPSPLSDDVNEICRVLSDFRQPHHDLEFALTSHSSKISSDIVEQVLKRCKGLGVSAHRFFLWAGKLPGFRHSRESYHILVEILGRCRQFPLIWDLLFELRDGGGHDFRPEIFWLMFRCYCRAKLPADAVRAFAKMGDFGLKPNIDDFHQLLINLCGNRLMDDARQIFEKVKSGSSFSVNWKSYSILMKGWVDCGNPAEALKVFNEMRSKCPPDVIAYNTYMDALCHMEDFPGAYRLLREMKSSGCEPEASTYAVLLRAHCESNDVDSADRVLHQMRRYRLVPNVFTYNCVVKLLCRNGKVDKAYEVLDEMVENGMKPDIWSYNRVLAVHCKLREVNKALRLLCRIRQEGGCSPDLHTYNMLLKMLVDVGRFDRATEVWDGMGKTGFYPSSSTYAVMIHGLCKKKGKVEDACKYFEMMVEEGIPPYLNTCEMIRDCLMQLGLRERVHVIRSKMERSTSVSIQELSGEVVERRRRRWKKERDQDEEDEAFTLMG